MLKPRIPATIAAIAALALPATALAQSAGDNQYQDPLAGTHSGTHHSSSGSSGSSGTSGSQASSPSTSGSSSPASTSTSASNAAASPSASSGKQLPRTGFELLLPIELGLALLLTGVTLRRVLVLRDRR